MNKDESLVQAVLSAAENPARAAIEVCQLPKFPPSKVALAAEIGRLEALAKPLPTGRSYENRRLAVATFCSTVTTMLLVRVPAASKHVRADSDTQVVDPHAVLPILAAR